MYLKSSTLTNRHSRRRRKFAAAARAFVTFHLVLGGGRIDLQKKTFPDDAISKKKHTKCVSYIDYLDSYVAKCVDDFFLYYQY